MYAASTAERDQQRQVLDEPVGVLAAADAHHVQDGLDADELERDVRHRGEDAGDRDRQRQALGAEAAADEVRGGDVAVLVRDRPQPRQEGEDQRVDEDRVRHREEAGRARRVDRRRDGDEGVRGVEVAAEQEPGDPGAEATGRPGPIRRG